MLSRAVSTNDSSPEANAETPTMLCSARPTNGLLNRRQSVVIAAFKRDMAGRKLTPDSGSGRITVAGVCCGYRGELLN